MDYFNNLDARQGLLYMLGTALTMYKEGVFNAAELAKVTEAVYSGLDAVLAADYDEASLEARGCC